MLGIDVIDDSSSDGSMPGLASLSSLTDTEDVIDDSSSDGSMPGLASTRSLSDEFDDFTGALPFLKSLVKSDGRRNGLSTFIYLKPTAKPTAMHGHIHCGPPCATYSPARRLHQMHAHIDIDSDASTSVGTEVGLSSAPRSGNDDFGMATEGCVRDHLTPLVHTDNNDNDDAEVVD